MPGKFRVEITQTAERDVTEIWEYIARDNSDAATEFILRLEDQINTLESFPERCPLVPENEWTGTAYRHLIYGNYRTIFKIVGARVVIMRILHGARLLDSGMLND